MNITVAEITGQRITFCALEQAGQVLQHLSITPLDYIDYHDARWEGNYVRVQIHLDVSGATQVTLGDHMTVRSFARLHDLLVGFQNGGAGSEVFGTADCHLDLTVEWREATRDVRFAGRIPAFEFTELVDQPLRLRDGIYRVLSFQFALELSALTQPIAQLKELLDLLNSLKHQPEGGKTTPA
jgi:hypothetical protein